MNCKQCKTLMKYLVLIALGCYFVGNIIAAKEKLDSKKIATLLRKINSDTVQGCGMILVITN